MSICDESDNENHDVKQEPTESDDAQLEEFPSGLESEEEHLDSQDVDDNPFQKFTESGKLRVRGMGP